MAAALTPRIRMMAICDGIRESKAEAGVFHLKGVHQAICAAAFPFRPSQLWLFLVMSYPRAGEFPCYVRVVNDQTARVVFYSHLDERPTFGPDGGLWATTTSIRCSFPQAGKYTIEVWFFQEDGSDVIKGETPFVIAKEENP
jgi:hypothetical protein